MVGVAQQEVAARGLPLVRREANELDAGGGGGLEALGPLHPVEEVRPAPRLRPEAGGVFCVPEASREEGEAGQEPPYPPRVSRPHGGDCIS